MKVETAALLAGVALLSACGDDAPCELFETRSECALASSFRLPEQLPPAVANPVADDEDAALVGFEIFFDARFSADMSVRCATCHPPEFHFQDGEPYPREFDVFRNTPSVRMAPYLSRWMWDGSADSLWSQPLLALEAPNEMDFGRVELVQRIAKSYEERYEAVFGPLPDTTNYPEKGRPGEASWEQLPEGDKAAINEVAANVGRALEAYMRKFPTAPSRFDRYLDGELDALDGREKRGFQVFFEAGCHSCHSGPQFSDSEFYNLGVPDLEGVEPDRGRAHGVEVLRDSDFAQAPPSDEGTLGAFRTPSLRDLPRTAPYGHSGVFENLEEVVRFHLEGGNDDPSTYVGEISPELVPVPLSKADVDALVAFLESLDGGDAPLPWGDWPDR